MKKQVTAWVCRFTGKTFLDRDEFREHLLRRRRKMTYARCHKRIVRSALIRASQISSIDELQDWLTSGDFALALARLRDPKAIINLSFVKIINHGVGEVSNSHSAPFDKPTNWLRKPDLPTSYPGISCRLSFRGNAKSSGSTTFWNMTDALREIGIHAGTGGGGGNDTYSYDCTIWADAFPKLFDRLLADHVGNLMGIAASDFSVEAV
jgi:hypothetical protein